LRERGYDVEVTSTGKAAVERLSDADADKPIHLVVINAASLRTSGKYICQNLRKCRENLPIIIISSPDQPKNTDDCANVVLNLPFTYRKIINRIVRLLPSDGKSIFKVGPIQMDLEQNRVACEGREARLTPRQAQLLQMLMNHHGEVVERERLFKQVWNTDYTGDTRTLDVHISWLRQAIEKDPRNPQFLKTIRGVGYRLDV
jgi:DNA-binding response OmpR family regulator